ncbi:PD40 domain-containing protein [Streptomyces sp. TLI_171]|uniref:PD40 domain-containing protein n=1 Tax=Streptomyces sp. TLI_171 TaxID=1938859 RepID=UPI000C184861|nr:PD40 domain-containing protein [Streptomyces sp. TLI_171]RKE20098.1 WD40 repeat protein [Streptomyces sp. TLI_171]
MSAHTRLRRSAAVALVSALTTGSALLLTACDPEGESTASATTAAPNATAPATSGGSASAGPAKGGSLNKTAGTGLTVSTGTGTVLMDGRSVDFGTVVRDLAWSPDGKHAAFVDGNGNLQTADPDGSHKTLIAKAPSGVTWSHPTWQVTSKDDYDEGRNNLIFTADDHGTLRLLGVAAKAGSTPAVLRLGSYGDEDSKPVPQTANQWPSSTGAHGTIVYANQTEGQVYIRDDYLRQQGGPVTKGSQPAADDQGDLVFVRSVGGHDHIFARANDEARQERDLTPDATVDYTEPVISHNGQTVAFRGPDGVYTLPAKGGKPEKVTDTVGLPAYRS